MESEIYQEAYLLLFRATEKALRAMERQNFGLAWDSLKEGQQQAEALFLKEAEDEEKR